MEERKLKKRMVSHPAHYNSGSIECIDALISARGKEAVKEFCICNAMKYLWRVGKKDDPRQEIRKAVWYLNEWLNLSPTEEEV